MSAQAPLKKTTSPRSTLIAGIALISIGVLTLVSQFARFPSLELVFLPALALIFLVWGSLTRNGGLLIPGGVLAGIGLGAILVTGPYASLPDEKTGGVFLLAFAAGWVLITLLSAVFTRCVMWWSLIVAGILSVVGAVLLVGGVALEALALLGKLWPLALVGVGAWLILRRKA